MIADKIKNTVRDIPNFPKEGVVFRDITPVLKDPELCEEIVEEMMINLKEIDFDVIAGVESRGLLFGFLLAVKMKKPFVMIRKEGKLPFDKVSQNYDLEYGNTSIEVHKDAVREGDKVLIHDDLLATGGTVEATKKLIERLGAKVTAFSFLVELDYLGGRDRLENTSTQVFSQLRYSE